MIHAVTPDLPAMAVVAGGHNAHCSSAIETVGGYVVVVTTSVRTLAVTLVSTYVGAIDGDTATTHLRLAPGRPAQLHQRLLSGAQPGQTHAAACLLDHTAELQELLIDVTGETVSIDVGTHTVQAAERAWTPAGGAVTRRRPPPL